MVSWNNEERERLDAILDHLIPANTARGIPGAGELGVAEFLARVAGGSATVADAIRRVLTFAAVQGDIVTVAGLRRIEADDPDSFRVLLTETYKGYYSRPDMRAAVGVGAHPVHPKGYDVAPEPADLMDALTAPVRARGPIYRDPTGKGST